MSKEQYIWGETPPERRPILARSMSDIEIEKLADALMRRLNGDMESRIESLVMDQIRSMETILEEKIRSEFNRLMQKLEEKDG